MNKKDAAKCFSDAKAQNENTFIDRAAIKYFPGWAAGRAKARYEREFSCSQLGALAAVNTFTGASKSRNATKGYTVESGDPDAQNNGELQTVRDRSRDLSRNNPIGVGALQNVKMYVVGDKGPTLNCQLDGAFLNMSDEQVEETEKTTQMEWDLYFNNVEFDIERTLKGPDFTAQTVHSWFASGDIFTVRSFKKRPGSPYGTKWQNIEADLCSNPDYIGDGEKANKDKYPKSTGAIFAGIEKDPKTNEPIAYYFQNKFSWSNRNDTSINWQRVPAFDAKGRKNVIHVYIKDRPKQTRGVSYLAPIIEPLKQLGRYTEGELMAAVVSGLYTMFLTSPEGRQLSPIAGSNQKESKNESIEAGYGNVVALKDGEKLDSVAPGRPNPNFDPFFDAGVKQIGAALGQPKEVLLKNFQSSYSAARAAMLEAWRFFKTIRKMVDRNWLDHIHAAFFEEAVALDRIHAPGFLNGDILVTRAWLAKEWIWPAQGMIRPEVEIKAIAQAEELGLQTKEMSTAQMNGGDYNRNYPQREKEAKKEKVIADITHPPKEVVQNEA